MRHLKSCAASCITNHERSGGWNNTLALLPYGDRFREYRRYMHQLLGNKNSMEQFIPVQERETHIFLQKVIEKPAELFTHIRRYVYMPRLPFCSLECILGRPALSYLTSHMATIYKEMTIPSSTWSTEQSYNSPCRLLQGLGLSMCCLF